DRGPRGGGEGRPPDPRLLVPVAPGTAVVGRPLVLRHRPPRLRGPSRREPPFLPALPGAGMGPLAALRRSRRCRPPGGVERRCPGGGRPRPPPVPGGDRRR